MVLRAIKYTRGHLSILDQLQLPHAEHYDDIHNTLDGWHAIKAMRVRGAPAIAIVAALSLAVELHVLHQSEKLSSVAEEVGVFILEKLDYLVTSRPTAVNLADAARKLKIVVEQRGKEEKATGAKMAETYIVAAERMLVDDVKDNQNIGDFGARWILERAGEKEVAILTHCNTGSVLAFGLSLRCTANSVGQVAGHCRLWHSFGCYSVSARVVLVAKSLLHGDSAVQPRLAAHCL